jgi:putative membrane protein
MKSTRILTAIIGASALMVACDGNTRDRNESSEATYINEDSTVGTSGANADGEGRGDAGAQQFVREAAHAGNAEVQLGQLAAQKGQSAQVKQFGQMMVTDHTKAGNELKQAVQPANIQVPSDTDEKHRKLYQELSEKSGAEFDRAYMDAMVKGHEDVKDLLEGRARNRSADISSRSTSEAGRPAATGTSGTSTNGSGTLQVDTALTQWASKTLPSVEQHLAKAKQIRDSVK